MFSSASNFADGDERDGSGLMPIYLGPRDPIPAGSVALADLGFDVATQTELDSLSGTYVPQDLSGLTSSTAPDLGDETYVWLDGTPRRVTLASLATIIGPIQNSPIIAPSGAVATPLGLTTALAAVNNSRFRLLDTDYDAIAGEIPQYRISARFSSGATDLTAGDVCEIDVYDAEAATSLLAATAAAPAASTAANIVCQAVTAWTAMPSSVKFCYLRIRNQTSARGAIISAWLEVRYV